MTKQRGCLIWALVVAVVGLSGCAARHYRSIDQGDLKGVITVEWTKPDLFIFIPSSTNPLHFTRARSGDVIQPDRMWTDGGSIPRSFWVFRNFSPWGYGPAFIVHDWLFHMQDCDLPGADRYEMKTAAIVMSEVMKTLMEEPGFDYGSKRSLYLMHRAVQTPIARESWEDHECQIPPLAPRVEPDETFVFEFG